MVYKMQKQQLRELRVLLGASLAALITIEERHPKLPAKCLSRIGTAKIILDFTFDPLVVRRADLKWGVRIINTFDDDISKLKIGVYHPEVLLKYVDRLLRLGQEKPLAELSYKISEARKVVQDAITELPGPPKDLNSDIAFYLSRKLSYLMWRTK